MIIHQLPLFCLFVFVTVHLHCHLSYSVDLSVTLRLNIVWLISVIPALRSATWCKRRWPMAGLLQLKPLEHFNFLQPGIWPKWKQRFEQFRLASGLSEEGAAWQISTLLYSMGPDSQDILETTRITAEERADYDSVVAKFDEYFGHRKNVIFKRAQFNSRRQQPGETGE